MGKKTLEEIGKILLISFISIMLTSIGVRRTLLDSKVDKVEFKEYKDEHKERHDRDRQDILYIRDKLDDLYEHELSKSN